MKKFILFITIAFSILLTNAQWSIDSLNNATSVLLSAGINNKVVFSNGTEWDLFDVTTTVHTYGSFLEPRGQIEIVQYGDNVYFGGGKFGYFADPQYSKNIDVYNSVTDTWSTLKLSKNREVGGAGAIGNKVLFAGGTGRSDISGPVYMYKTVDIFDVLTGVKTNANLSQARSNIAVGATGNKIVFAGGWYWDFSYSVLPSNRADIYDVSTNTWTKTNLSKKREDICSAVVGEKIIFAGGFGLSGPLKNVDIYNSSTNTWSTTNLITANYAMVSVVVGNKAFFAGGSGGNLVQVYDADLNSWSTFNIPINLTSFKMNALNGKIYFSGGFDAATSSYSNLVQIYDPSTSLWTNEYLSQGRIIGGAATTNGVIAFAGGTYAYAFPIPLISNRVDLYFVPMRSSNFYQNQNIPIIDLEISPNPFVDQITLNAKSNLELPIEITIYDHLGKAIKKISLKNEIQIFQMSDLMQGIYYFTYILPSGESYTKKVIKLK